MHASAPSLTRPAHSRARWSWVLCNPDPKTLAREKNFMIAGLANVQELGFQSGNEVSAGKGYCSALTIFTKRPDVVGP